MCFENFSRGCKIKISGLKHLPNSLIAKTLQYPRHPYLILNYMNGIIPFKVNQRLSIAINSVMFHASTVEVNVYTCESDN